MSSHKEAPDVFHELSFSKVRRLAADRATFADDMHLHSQATTICYSIGSRAPPITIIECGVRKAAASPLASSAHSAAHLLTACLLLVHLLTARLGCLSPGRRLVALSGRLVGCSQLAVVPVRL